MMRATELRKSARDKPCTLRIPGVCRNDTSTTVWAHSNEIRHGKGTGNKAHDLFGCYACGPCHHWYDAGTASRAEKRARFRDAWEMSLIMACESGLFDKGDGRA